MACTSSLADAESHGMLFLPAVRRKEKTIVGVDACGYQTVSSIPHATTLSLWAASPDSLRISRFVI